MNTIHQNAQTLLPRSRLMQEFSQGSGKILYLHAPAGFGKTVAAGLWISSLGAESAVITLDEYDNKLAFFCQRLCRALAGLEPGNEKLREYADNASLLRAPHEFAVHAAAALSENLQGCLVLDDLHYITNLEIQRFLPVLFKRFPPGLQLMLLSRAAPPESFSEMILKDELHMVGGRALQFSENEIQELFASNRHPIDNRQARRLWEHTGGWPIGIGAVLLSGGPLPADRLTTLGYLDHFIKTQLWEKWGRRIRVFLMKTSIADELTPELCNALTGEENSALMLETLAERGAFVDTSDHHTYHVHQIFRGFLLARFEENSEAFRQRQYQLAAGWYYRNGEMYKALDFFTRCGDADFIASYLSGAVHSPLGGTFHIDKMLTLAKLPIVRELSERHWLFLSIRAWTCFLEGRAAEFEQCLDDYYARYAVPVEDPSPLISMYYLQCLDYRRPLASIQFPLAGSEIFPSKNNLSGTITQNMSLFHRSSRDYSEFALGDSRRKISAVKASIGPLFGDEADLLECCLLAGVKYEQGQLVEAHSLVLAAGAKIRDHFTAESKFAFMLLLALIQRALWQYDRAEMLIKDIQAMIEREKAFYLNDSFEAFLCHCRLADGDTAAAAEWLAKMGQNPFQEMPFYQLNQFFTTLRAHICLENYDRAILISNRILELCEAYRRPLDIIEANVLIAIAYWRKNRGHQRKALRHMEAAICMAAEYGYTQVFASEGAGVGCMLLRLQKSPGGELPEGFVRKIQLLADAHARHSRGLRVSLPENLSFTAKQLGVMQLLYEGLNCRQISAQLGIQYSTVRSHLGLIYKKLAVDNVSGARHRMHDLGIWE